MTAGNFRARVRYTKEGRLRYLGHLEVLRTVDRCIRRSGLPFAVTQGFSPHMRIAFSSALPTATSSACEYYDLILTEPIPVQRVLASLAAATPKDLKPVAAGYVDMHEPSLEAWLTRSNWLVRMGRADLSPEDLARALEKVASKGTIEYLRGDKPKVIDLGTTLVGWSCPAHDGLAEATIGLETRSGQRGSLRPTVLVEAIMSELGLAMTDIPSIGVSRTGQWHEEGDTLVEPLERCAGVVCWNESRVNSAGESDFLLTMN